ncbi:hypothetical protein [Dietzia sp. ANT_WB102]|uniref:hypothetical protein n=1 Tax=Dietzia sp. ANT_WB102 TaxID=2597345 RepID=UPI00165DBF88|nr:hypothetical protein [Dietzia sp. ANT_WB102]
MTIPPAIAPADMDTGTTRVPHSLSAAGARPAQLISVFNDEEMRMHTHTAAA